MKRAALIWNPTATTTTAGVRDVIARALSSDLLVEVFETRERGHATDLAAEAARGQFDLVVALGGDGTMNEVVNGLAGTTVPLATIPGGGTNVLARTLGYPSDAVEATASLLAQIRNGLKPMTIPIGRINGRAFAFCAGAGFDADVVRRVEENPAAKQRFGEMFFIAAGVRQYFQPRGRPRVPMTMHWDGGVAEGVKVVIVGNSDPYTFLGKRPFRVVPGATLERASLDVTALRTTRIHTLLKVLFTAFGSADHVDHKHVVALRDISSFRLTAPQPVPYQVDGDVAGEASNLQIWSEPNALRVLPLKEPNRPGSRVPPPDHR